MTPPWAALVAAIQKAVDRGLVQDHDDCDALDLMIFGKPCNCGKGELLSALAALTVEPTPEAVEALAREMFETASAAGDWRAELDPLDPLAWEGLPLGAHHPWLCVAHWLLTPSAGGGA